eukprot:765151-Hanusia_phi.AAC.2
MDEWLDSLLTDTLGDAKNALKVLLLHLVLLPPPRPPASSHLLLPPLTSCCLLSPPSTSSLLLLPLISSSSFRLLLAVLRFLILSQSQEWTAGREPLKLTNGKGSLEEAAKQQDSIVLALDEPLEQVLLEPQAPLEVGGGPSADLAENLTPSMSQPAAMPLEEEAPVQVPPCSCS